MNYFGLFGSDDDVLPKKASSQASNQVNQSVNNINEMEYEDGEVSDDSDIFESEYSLPDQAKEQSNLTSSQMDLTNLNPKLCVVCQENEPKYKCPACLMRTCSLQCVDSHKERFDCDGKRNITPFKRINEFDDKQLFKDYFFLEDGSRLLDSLKRDRKNIIKSMSQLPPWLKKLLYEARCRGTRLRILPAGFAKRCRNKTTYMYDSKEVNWDVELIFTHLVNNENIEIKPSSVTFNRISETKTLREIVNSWINPDQVMESIEIWKKMKCYREADPSSLLALFYDGKKFFHVDLDQQLTKILEGKTVIEYPTFIITFVDHKNLFNIEDEAKSCNDKEVKDTHYPSHHQNRRHHMRKKGSRGKRGRGGKGGVGSSGILSKEPCKGSSESSSKVSMKSSS